MAPWWEIALVPFVVIGALGALILLAASIDAVARVVAGWVRAWFRAALGAHLPDLLAEELTAEITVLLRANGDAKFIVSKLDLEGPALGMFCRQMVLNSIALAESYGVRLEANFGDSKIPLGALLGGEAKRERG